VADSRNSFTLPVLDTARAAWAKVYGAKGTIWAAFIIYFIVAMVFGVIEGLLETTPYFLQVIINIVFYLILFVFVMGLLYIGITRAKDAPISYKLLFYAFDTNMALKLIAVYLLQILIFIPAVILMVIGFILGNISGFLTVLSLIASLALYVYLLIRVILSLGFVLDKDLGPVQAIKASFRATRDNVWNVLGIVAIQIVIIAVCLIPYGIGSLGFLISETVGSVLTLISIPFTIACFVWAMPFGLILYGMLYKALSEKA
jgi:hypothetical protein